ncbi:MAG: LPXTG cell wall anchor domain-containing protein [Sphingomonas sp.]|nr:LPXTG cell wall anchor domain-containing protein [Sphingomonas sp.]
MTKKALFARPAQTAIAAVLALLATPAIAQVADPVGAPADTASAPAADPVIVPDTAAPAAAIPVPGVTPPQIVMPTPPAGLAPTATATEPTVTPRPNALTQREVTPAPAAESTTRTTAARTATPALTRASTAATAAPIAAPATAQPAATPLPNVTPSQMMAMQAQADQPAAPQTAETAPPPEAGSDDTAYWAIGGGIALLLGAGAIAALRRKHERAEAPQPAAIAPRAVTREQVAVEPVAVMPAMPASPPPEPAFHAGDARFGSLEAMVAAAPSAENPFLTRRNRLRRANFLLRNGQLPATSQAATPVRTAAAAAPAQQPQKAAQPVYSFGGQASYRSRGWKPATT